MPSALRTAIKADRPSSVLVQGLKKQGPNAFCNALQQIPRSLRSMYVHAYQSFLWNAAATHRVSAFGAGGAVAGDLVLDRTSAGGTAPADGDSVGVALGHQPCA
jgi:tRNA pseudouridine13 synthase